MGSFLPWAGYALGLVSGAGRMPTCPGHPTGWYSCGTQPKEVIWQSPPPPTQAPALDTDLAFPDQTPEPTEATGTPTDQATEDAPKTTSSGPAIGEIMSRTIFTGDNLNVLRGMNSDTVDLIYLDPPFNSDRNYNAPIGSKAAGAAFKDTWTLSDVDLAEHDLLEKDHPKLHTAILAAQKTAGDSTMSYLIMTAPRLVEMQRILKPTGSIYLHCDSTEGAYLKMVMDAIFRRGNFRNEIVWDYKKVSNSKARKFLRAHDTILFYTNSDEYTYNEMYDSELSPRKQQLVDTGYNTKRMKGDRYLYIYDQAKVDQRVADGRLRLEDFDIVREVDVTKGNRFTDVFSINFINSQSKEYVGYPTQKPTALLERIIKASTNPGDVVLDPFCGCATAAIAAEKTGRRWVGIDLSPKAFELVNERLDNYLNLPGLSPTHRTDQPHRTDLGKLPRPRTHLKDLWWEQDGHCASCGMWFPPEGHDVDHVVPNSKGGTDHISNLQCLCRKCNAEKGDRPMSYIQARQLKKHGISYGGKVEKMVAEHDKRLAEDGGGVPEGVLETLEAAGLDPEKASGLLAELAAALTPKSTEEAADGK